MWPFSGKSHRVRQLTGVSERLWSYDARHHKGWQLDTDNKPLSRQPQAHRKFTVRRVRQQMRLTHYIGAGGMRHETRDKAVRRRPVAGQERVWKLFLLFIVIWLVFRFVPC